MKPNSHYIYGNIKEMKLSNRNALVILWLWLASPLLGHGIKDTLIHNKEINQVVIPDKLNIELPKEYFQDKQESMKDYLPAFATILAGFFSAGLTAYVAWRSRKQTKEAFMENRAIKFSELEATINSRNNQEWRNQFREGISQYISILQLFLTGARASNEKINETLKELFSLKLKVELLLNPKKEDELKLLVALGDLHELVTRSSQDRKDGFDKKVKDITMWITQKSQELIERKGKEIEFTLVDRKKPA